MYVITLDGQVLLRFLIKYEKFQVSTNNPIIIRERFTFIYGHVKGNIAFTFTGLVSLWVKNQFPNTNTPINYMSNIWKNFYFILFF